MGISLYPSLLNAAGPDAITSLLQQLTGAQMPPVQTTPSNNPAPELPKPVAAALPAASLLAPQDAGPKASPLPPISPMTAQSLLQYVPSGEPKRSLLGRVVHNLASLPGAVANAAKEPIPPEYQAAVKAGLLTPQEVESARPGFLSSFAGTAAQHEGGAQGAYRENLGGILAVHQLAQQQAEEKRLQAVRANMATIFQPKPGASLAEQRDLVTQAYLYAIRNNDLATAKSLEPTAKEALTQMTSPAALHEVPGVGLVDVSDRNNPRVVVPIPAGSEAPHLVNAQEGVFVLKPDGLYSAASGEKYTGKMVHPIAMQPSFTTTNVSPTPGAPAMVTPMNTRTGAPGKPLGYTPAAGAGGTGGATGLGSAGVGGVARQLAAIVGLNNANERLTPFETAVANGTANYTGLDYWKGMRAKMYDAKGIKDEALHADLYATLNQENPELANYLVAAEQWALEDSQLSNRPSDFRTKLDAFVSAIGPRAGAKMIGNVQKFRTTRLAELEIARKAMEAIMARIAASGGSAPNDAASPSVPTTPPAPTGPKTITVNGKKFIVP